MAQWIRYNYFSTTRYLFKNYYEVLKVSKDCSQKEIKDAFVKLSKQLHPDKSPEDPEQHEKFVKLNQAYSVLSKPDQRKLYNEQLQAEKLGQNLHGRVFSDTIFNPRQQYWSDTTINTKPSADPKFHQNYYGIKGVKRVTNSRILLGCIAVIIFGIVGHFFLFRFIKDYNAKTVEFHNRKNQAIYQAVKEEARDLEELDQQLERIFKSQE